MVRFVLFGTAVVVLYVGGFVYEHIGPVLYSLIITLIASIPLLLKGSFWKKIILMVPLLVLRVVGKIFLILFGKNALSRVLAKYGLLERRFNRTIETIEQSKHHMFNRWNDLTRATQAYLLLIFFPVALAIFVIALLIKIIRLRFLQFMIEKLMQNFLMKWTSTVKKKLAKPKLPALPYSGSQKTHSQEQVSRSKMKATLHNKTEIKSAEAGQLAPKILSTADKNNDNCGDGSGSSDCQDRQD